MKRNGENILTARLFYVPSYNLSIKRLLRRSVYLSVLYSAIASQFTQSKAKGRTLQLYQFYSTKKMSGLKK
jgi:hypothetical protein